MSVLHVYMYIYIYYIYTYVGYIIYVYTCVCGYEIYNPKLGTAILIVIEADTVHSR